MRITQINRNLSIFFAAQLVLLVIFWWPKGSETVGKKYLLEDYPWSEFHAFTIMDGTKEVSFVKENEEWLVPDHHRYPADPEKIGDLFQKLEKIQIGYVIGKTKPTQKRLGVTDGKYQRKILFQKKPGDKDKSQEGFYLGTSPQFRKIHMRRVDQDNIYITNQIATYDFPVTGENWLNKKVMDIDSKDVVAIELSRKRGKETFRFTKTEKEIIIDPIKTEEGEEASNEPKFETIWLLGKKEVNKSVFDGMLRKLSRLNLSEVLGKEEKRDYGLKNPQVQVKITFKTGEGEETQDKVLAIGRKEEADHIVQMKDSPFYLKVASHQLKAVLKTTRKEFTEKK